MPEFKLKIMEVVWVQDGSLANLRLELAQIRTGIEEKGTRKGS